MSQSDTPVGRPCPESESHSGSSNFVAGIANLSDDELAAQLRARGLNSSEIEIVLRDRDDLLEQILEARDA